MTTSKLLPLCPQCKAWDIGAVSLRHPPVSVTEVEGVIHLMLQGDALKKPICDVATTRSAP